MTCQDNFPRVPQNLKITLLYGFAKGWHSCGSENITLHPKSINALPQDPFLSSSLQTETTGYVSGYEVAMMVAGGTRVRALIIKVSPKWGPVGDKALLRQSL